MLLAPRPILWPLPEGALGASQPRASLDRERADRLCPCTAALPAGVARTFRTGAALASAATLASLARRRQSAVRRSARQEVKPPERRRSLLAFGAEVLVASLSSGLRGAASAAESVSLPKPLLEGNPMMKSFFQKFTAQQNALQALKSPVEGADREIVRGALDCIAEFLSSNVWEEIGPLGVREAAIWSSYVKSEGKAPPGAADVLFLREYYAFWSTFNSLFDMVLVSLSPTLPRTREKTGAPQIQELVDIDNDTRQWDRKVAYLPRLFRDIYKAKPGEKRFGKMASSERLKEKLDSVQAAKIISSFCQGGIYAPGLEKLVQEEVPLLRFVKALDEKQANPQVPALLQSFAGGADAVAMEGDTVFERKVVLLLYRLQSVFLYLNGFQEEVLNSLLTKKY
eukprot:TRINITY_DN91512_c0_g1_i1.p1 TRINITY_DN91512_c0_g1~~TRINITY_DN91512_c0_g1_i1.p1  ORF type:complete len:399 (+),score=75.29 TRINITY_DN91512_c0_g1_i1:59-1255(+)